MRRPRSRGRDSPIRGAVPATRARTAPRERARHPDGGHSRPPRTLLPAVEPAAALAQIPVARDRSGSHSRRRPRIRERRRRFTAALAGDADRGLLRHRHPIERYQPDGRASVGSAGSRPDSGPRAGPCFHACACRGAAACRGTQAPAAPQREHPPACRRRSPSRGSSDSSGYTSGV